VRYLAALHHEVIARLRLFSLFFLAYLLLTLVVCNLVEPFNNSAGLKAVQVNKTPCSVQWLLDLLWLVPPF